MLNPCRGTAFGLPMRFLAFAILGLASCGSEPALVDFPPEVERLRSLHRPLAPPEPGDWLAEHSETGQTFAEYIASDPKVPQGERDTIYILPIGEFVGPQKRIFDDTVEFLALFYNLRVEFRDAISLDEIPNDARRVHPSWGMRQLHTGYILQRVLEPTLPDDAAAYLALTSEDLWPGDGWNFVFGQASIEKRVGVWSVHRNGDPGASEDEYRTCLLRSIKTAAHETGHIFSIRHCTAYECLMCGSNSQEESDRKPLWLGPECLAKVLWATGSKLEGRYGRLQSFCEKRELSGPRW